MKFQQNASNFGKRTNETGRIRIFYIFVGKKKTHKWNKDIFSLKKKIDMKKKTLYIKRKKKNTHPTTICLLIINSNRLLFFKRTKNPMSPPWVLLPPCQIKVKEIKKFANIVEKNHFHTIFMTWYWFTKPHEDHTKPKVMLWKN